MSSVSRKPGRTTRPRTAASARRPIKPRRRPRQQRGEQRVSQILDVTARLLERDGLDNLSTNHIAAAMGVSVGVLYHYFPNKQAILYAMGRRWLDEWQLAFDEIEALGLRGVSIHAFVDRAMDRMLQVYRGQTGVLHLVQAMFTVPELRRFDTLQDELVERRLSVVFGRLGIRASGRERARLARVYMKLCNALLPEIIRQQGAAARATLSDLKRLLEKVLARGSG